MIIIMLDTFFKGIFNNKYLKSLLKSSMKYNLSTGFLIPPLGYNYQYSWLAGLTPSEAQKSFYYVLEKEAVDYFQKRELNNSKFMLNKLPLKPSYLKYFLPIPYLNPLASGYKDSFNIPTNLFFENKEWENKSFVKAFPNYAKIKDVKKLISEFNDIEFSYLHIPHLDALAHQYDLNNPLFIEKARMLDNLIEQIIFKSISQNKKLLIFGDHGSLKVEHRINIVNYLENLNVSWGKNSFYFVDSTYLRIWCYDSKDRRIIKNELQHVKKITSLDSNMFGHKIFGHYLYICDENCVFQPNSFLSEFDLVNMHGYLPNVKDNWSMYISNFLPKNETIAMHLLYSSIVNNCKLI